MSVVGIGTDIVAVGRIAELVERHGARWLGRCFREGEVTAGSSAAALAARWAAKEAFLKALGRDVRGIPYRDVEVARSSAGPIRIIPHGRARQALAAAKGRRVHLSVSHERHFAVAMVLIEG